MESHNNAAAAPSVEDRATQLLKSLKGIANARVQVDARGRIERVYLEPVGIDDRQAMRNAQSALMAVLGQNIDVNTMVIGDVVPVMAPVTGPVTADENVVDLFGGSRKSDLHEAARVAFDTLRAAQSSFHGYQFDGAELVRISGQQYVVVSLKRGVGDTRFGGAAPVTDTVAHASARALMNAVGVAAMGATHMELLHTDDLTRGTA